ncbi:MAG TPA: thymidine phosphorylase [Bacteroidota bacterium]|nr:thymidine phosphorylase [Bacteroidota bacterium]
MNTVELIRKKRDGAELSGEEIGALIAGYARGDVPDYQMAAFLMAVFQKGMTHAETARCTDAMLHSGVVVDLGSIPGRKVDKHSTGGVGDKVSLILAPVVASCGVPVPMISGRGLGHTGGTLDKLESIPGFRTALSLEEYRSVIRDTNLVLSGQTAEIVPADRKMYALRDVTATVESIPLIAGSIMSKKLAEGIDALVLDVKTGNGAFMQSEEDAAALARALVEIGTRCGKETVAFITAMDQPLGMMIGNWLEIVEAIDCLKGKNIPDLMELVYVLGGTMVMLGGKAGTIAEGIALCRSAVWSGKAFEKFLQIVGRQGGDASFIRDPSRYPVSACSRGVKADRAGYVTAFATRRIGVLAVELGAGRLKVDDVVDPKAGIILNRKKGDRVARGDTLATILTDREDVVDRAAGEFLECITIGDAPPLPSHCIRSLVDSTGIHAWSTPVVY